MTWSLVIGAGGAIAGMLYAPDVIEDDRPVIMFSLTPETLSTALVTAHFNQLEPVRDRIIYKAGARAGRFYYRVGRGFHTGRPVSG